jgi:monoamine oxidase
MPTTNAAYSIMIFEPELWAMESGEASLSVRLRKETIMSTTQNQSPKEHDLVILGSGTGGTVAAWIFAGQGHRVAVVERKYVGGSCPNIACLPSKNVIHSAKVASYLRRSDEFGIPKREFAVDMREVRERKRRMVSAGTRCILKTIRIPVRNSSWARGASSARKPWRSHFRMGQSGNSAETT